MINDDYRGPCNKALLAQHCWQRHAAGFLSGTTVTQRILQGGPQNMPMTCDSHGLSSWDEVLSLPSWNQNNVFARSSGKTPRHNRKHQRTSMCQALWTCGRKNMETLVMWVLARGQRKAFYILGGVESLVVYAYNYYLVSSCEVPLASASDRDELPNIPCLLIWVGKITLQTSWFTDRHMTSYWSIWIIITRSVRTRCCCCLALPKNSTMVSAEPRRVERAQQSARRVGKLTFIGRAAAHCERVGTCQNHELPWSRIITRGISQGLV
jgi:hypothetical protein